MKLPILNRNFKTLTKIRMSWKYSRITVFSVFYINSSNTGSTCKIWANLKSFFRVTAIRLRWKLNDKNVTWDSKNLWQYPFKVSLLSAVECVLKCEYTSDDFFLTCPVFQNETCIVNAILETVSVNATTTPTTPQPK